MIRSFWNHQNWHQHKYKKKNNNKRRNNLTEQQTKILQDYNEYQKRKHEELVRKVQQRINNASDEDKPKIEKGQKIEERWNLKQTHILEIVMAAYGVQNTTVEIISKYIDNIFTYYQKTDHIVKLKRKIAHANNVQTKQLKNTMVNTKSKNAQALQEIAQKHGEQGFQGYSEQEVQQFIQHLVE